MVQSAALRTSPDRRDMRWAALGLGLALVLVIYANLNVQEGENGGTGPLIVTVILDLLLAAVLFGWLLPRVTNDGRTAVILGVLAIVTAVVFWSGFPFILGAAAVALGARGARSGMSRAGLVLGALAMVLGVTAFAIDLAR